MMTRRHTLSGPVFAGCLAALALCAQVAMPGVVQAATCAVDPTKGAGAMSATGRFGAYRQYYNNGRGGGHGGQDIGLKTGTQLYAPFDGTVTKFGSQQNGAGNFLAIRNASGDEVWMMHLSGYASGIKLGSAVTAGQFVALSGNTGHSTGAHLHLEYTVKKSEDVRDKWIQKGMTREQVFQAKNNYHKKSDGTYTTDPAGYMCDAYTFVGNAAKDNAVLGKDTKAQYAILYGSVPNGTPPDTTGYTPLQSVQANSVAILANANGKTVTDFLSDKDSFGSLPGIRYDQYEDVSPSEMMTREAKRRLTDVQWHENLTMVSERALWIEYLQTIAVGNYMENAIYRKREKVEGLLATLVSLNSAEKRKRVDQLHDIATHESSVNATQ